LVSLLSMKKRGKQNRPDAKIAPTTVKNCEQSQIHESK